ncbi:MAG TPA: oligosaccharide flippase family protein [Patescibacteria group bacterium]|nr:oligosaccharide flippase family protein [Patescibacteria group bacterium]
MRERAKQLVKHPLIYGSSIVVIGNLAANFFNFLFNIFMNKHVSVADYGVLLSVMSIIAYPALIGSAVVPVVVRFAGIYFAQNNFSMLRGLYVKIKKLLLLIAIIFFVSFLFAMPSINSFFHINNTNILIMTNIIIFFSLIGVVNMAFLQAKLAFAYQVFVNFLNAIIKLSLGMVLVFAGFSVSGATMAMIVAGVLAYCVSFLPLRFIFDRKITVPAISSKELFFYGLPASLTLVGLTSLISTDILLVKHFFSPHDAGLYAGLSLLGRIIFFVSAPIGTVMFPLITQKHSKGENYTNTFKLALLLIGLSSLLLTIFYALFPKFAISLLLKDEYFVIAPYLALFALFIACYCVLSIICTFYLSIKKTKIFIPILVGAVLQIVFIVFFHESFIQIIWISLLITFLLVLGLLLYYPYATKSKK